jgi:hypothetical protein
VVRWAARLKWRAVDDQAVAAAKLAASQYRPMMPGEMFTGVSVRAARGLGLSGVESGI